jgi:hypothetical protein
MLTRLPAPTSGKNLDVALAAPDMDPDPDTDPDPQPVWKVFDV